MVLFGRIAKWFFIVALLVFSALVVIGFLVNKTPTMAELLGKNTKITDPIILRNLVDKKYWIAQAIETEGIIFDASYRGHCLLLVTDIQRLKNFYINIKDIDSEKTKYTERGLKFITYNKNSIGTIRKDIPQKTLGEYEINLLDRNAIKVIEKKLNVNLKEQFENSVKDLAKWCRANN